MNAIFTPIPSTISTDAHTWYVPAGIPASGPTTGEPPPMKSRAIPTARERPAEAVPEEVPYPAPIASPPSCQIRNVEVTAMSSQKNRSVIQSPAKTTPSEAPA